MAENSEDKTISIFRLLIKPLIICITILICLYKLGNVAENIFDSANTTTIHTNYTVITNVRIISNDAPGLNYPPFTDPYFGPKK
jgi:hypothetical protein